MARPRLKVDEDAIVKLGRLGCSLDEIAEFVGCSERTIRRRFAAAYARARAEAKLSLRRAQYRRAIIDGSDKMLIFLGRTILGQTYGGDPGPAALWAEVARQLDEEGG